jgi:hypothetical protein
MEAVLRVIGANRFRACLLELDQHEASGRYDLPCCGVVRASRRSRVEPKRGTKARSRSARFPHAKPLKPRRSSTRPRRGTRFSRAFERLPRRSRTRLSQEAGGRRGRCAGRRGNPGLVLKNSPSRLQSLRLRQSFTSHTPREPMSHNVAVNIGVKTCRNALLSC